MELFTITAKRPTIKVGLFGYGKFHKECANNTNSMGKFCLYADIPNEAPCIVIPMYKYSYLESFMSDVKHTKGIQRHSVPIKISCLKGQQNTRGRFTVKDELCVNCLFCVFGCIGNKILISKKYHPLEFCYDITQEELEELSFEVSKLFKGEFIRLPKVPLSQINVKYKSFEDFTSIKRRRISPYGLLML